jgi:hypothetical protein
VWRNAATAANCAARRVTAFRQLFNQVPIILASEDGWLVATFWRPRTHRLGERC